ncbi:MAG TPA: dTDP-4-dehydrorhamnose reductase [Polyangiaceae bacterium]
MKILLLGANGQLGYELRGALSCFAEVSACSRAEADLADEASTRDLIARLHPAVIVNASAYTDVDGAEREPKVAHHINGHMVGVLGEEAVRRGAGLVHFSTDFVFDGEKGTPYVETDTPHPLGEYARSKLAGEKMLAETDAPAIVFRTAWVYSLRRKSFVTTMLRLAREKETLGVVTDQVGSPTFCRDLAEAVAMILYRMGGAAPHAIAAARGIYHLAGAGSVSRFEWTRAILELDPKKSEHRTKTLSPIRSADFPLPARRPLATPLDCTKARDQWGIALPDWRDALARALSS